MFLCWCRLSIYLPFSATEGTNYKCKRCSWSLCALIAYLIIFFGTFYALVGLADHGYLWQSLRWRHNDHAGVSNHQPHGCLLNRLFRRKSKKTSKLRVTGLCAGNSPGTGEFPAQMASYAENVSICWRHHGKTQILLSFPGAGKPLKWSAFHFNVQSI